MATDWESTLESWVKPASDTEEEKKDRMARAITDAVRKSALPMPSLRIYPKGSYANNTNVRNDSDVDVAVEYHAMVYSELREQFEGADQTAVGLYPSPDPYNNNTGAFKDAVEAAMVAQFGSAAVSRGDKSLTIRQRNNALSADVIPCFEYRRYDRREVNGEPHFDQGSVLFPDSGGRIVNYPHHQLENGNAKNNRTGRRYKRMVRALKRLENKLNDEGLLPELPSYFIECLVYNVPDEGFMNNLLRHDFRFVLLTIFNETLPQGGAYANWGEVNWIKWLFKGDQKWTTADAHKLADVAWDYVGFG